MKKILTLLMAVALIFTVMVVFASCGEENTGTDSEAVDTTETQNTESSGSTEESGENTTDDEGPKNPGITPDKPSEPDLGDNGDLWTKNY